MHACMVWSSIFETQCKQCQATGNINLPPETGLDSLEPKVNVVTVEQKYPGHHTLS